MGQNIYLQKINGRRIEGIKISKGVKKWFDEISDFNENKIDPFIFEEAYGHFSQVAWADTNEVNDVNSSRLNHSKNFTLKK